MDVCFLVKEWRKKTFAPSAPPQIDIRVDIDMQTERAGS